MEEMVFLKNYLPYEIIKIEDDIELNTLVKGNKLLKNNIIFENETLRKGDLLININKANTVHIVLPHENLQTIANKYNVTVEQIKQNNSVSKIFIGQQLFI